MCRTVTENRRGEAVRCVVGESSRDVLPAASRRSVRDRCCHRPYYTGRGTLRILTGSRLRATDGQQLVCAFCGAEPVIFPSTLCCMAEVLHLCQGYLTFQRSPLVGLVYMECD